MNSDLLTPTPLSKIAVLGAGSWGTAIAIHLAKLHPKVYLWGRDAEKMADYQRQRVNPTYLPNITFPPHLVATADPVEFVSQVEAFVIAVPSHAFLACLNYFKPYIQGTQYWISATKGLQDNGMFLHQAIESVLGKEIPKGIITGPSFARELASGLPTALVMASENIQQRRVMGQLFAGPRCRIYGSDDLIGAQLGGAIKNVLAIATGCSDGLGFGANARSALITRGLAEMIRLGKQLGARQETLMGLAGLGDLVLTCTDDKSRNRRFGLALGQGLSPEAAMASVGQVVEGAKAADYTYQLAQQQEIEMPITEQVYCLLKNEYSPSMAVEKLFGRENEIM